MNTQWLGASGLVILTLGGAACTGQLDIGRVGGDGGGSAGNLGVDSSAGVIDSSPGSSDSGSDGVLPEASASHEDSGTLAQGDATTSSALDGAAAGPVSYDAAPPGLAGFAFVIKSVVQEPETCPSEDWEFAPFPGGVSFAANASEYAMYASCGPELPPACTGVTSVLLANTGQLPMPYIAAALWSGSGYVPGVTTGDTYELTGVLDPGGQVDITSVFAGGTVAILGSADPFSSVDASAYAYDEGMIPWPAGVAGSGGATEMHIAEIEIVTACRKAFQNF